MAPPDPPIPWLRDARVSVALVALVTVLTLVHPIYPRDQLLQQIGTVTGLVFLHVAGRRWRVSSGACSAFAFFLLLHVVGARWVYSYVPYDDGLDALFGFRPGDVWHWQRNHYDRFVHAAYGVLALPIFAGAAERVLGVTRRAAVLVAWLAIAATSALYELGEWTVALVAAPERALTYLGQQGDPWDAQADMALAIAGASVTGAWLVFRARER